MPYEELAAAFDLDGAFNYVALKLERAGAERAVIAALDRLLQRYGGLSAYGRSDQLSNRFLSDELAEIGIMTTFIPGLFLAVASFLLYVVLSRLVATQRTEIGLLKAFGRSNLRVGLHYLFLAMATVAIGLLVGLSLGVYLGGVFVDVYKDYFHFPDLHLVVSAPLVLTAAAVSMLAAAVGALVAVRRAVVLPPAEAMRPEPPANFRAGLMEWGGVTRRLPASLRMIARNLARRPWKAVLSVLGIALAVGLMVVGRFGLDGASYMMAVQFNQVQRDDVTVLYNEPRAAIEINCIDCHGSVRQRANLLTSGPAAPVAAPAAGKAPVVGRNLTRGFTVRDEAGAKVPVFQRITRDRTKKDEHGKDVALKNGDLIQNSLVVSGRWWRVPQTIDTITPGTRDYSEKSRYAKTMRKDNATWGELPAADNELAHRDDNMTCFACHSAWVTSCFGCHLQMKANRKMPNRHNEGGDSRNFTEYNFQVLRDDIFMLGRDGTVTVTNLNEKRLTHDDLYTPRNQEPEIQAEPDGS